MLGGDWQEKLAPFTTELHVPLAQDLEKLKEICEYLEEVGPTALQAGKANPYPR